MFRFVSLLCLLLVCIATAQGAIFADIVFGDSYGAVEEKLLKSDLAKTDLPETMLGRTGINGVFKTTRQLGGKQFELFFVFEGQRLTELQLHSAQSGTFGSARSLLTAAAREISILYGAPSQKGDTPQASQLPRGSAYLFQTWHPSSGGTILCGFLKTDDGIKTVISFTSEKIRLRKVPE